MKAILFRVGMGRSQLLLGIFFIFLFTGLFLLISPVAKGEESGIGLQPVAYLPIVIDQSIKNAGWSELGANSASAGGISDSMQDSIDPVIATAPNGDLYVAWTEVITAGVNGRSDIYVLKWDGNSWAEVGTDSATGGGISNTNNYSLNPDIAISASGIPYVAWSDEQANSQIYVRRLNGETWEEVGTGSASANGISDTEFPSELPSIGLTPTETPFVLWTDHSASSMYMRTLSATTWTEVSAGSASGLGITGMGNHYEKFSLAIAPNGQPTIASADNISSSGYDVVVRQWDGNSWNVIGGDAIVRATDNTSLHTNDWNPEIAIAPNGHIFVAWPDNLQNEAYDLRLREWNGSAWNIVGTDVVRTVVTDHFRRQSIGIAIGVDGHPILAWKGFVSPQYELYAQRWTGSIWADIGEKSSTGNGISDNVGDSDNLSLAVAPDDTIYLAWNDDTNGDDQIYIRSWQD